MILVEVNGRGSARARVIPKDIAHDGVFQQVHVSVGETQGLAVDFQFTHAQAYLVALVSIHSRLQYLAVLDGCSASFGKR